MEPKKQPVRRPYKVNGKLPVSPKVSRAIELIPETGSLPKAAAKAGVSVSNLRKVLRNNLHAKSYLERYLVQEGIREAEHLRGLLEVNATMLFSAERAMMSKVHEGEFEISERTALPLQVAVQSIKIGSELLGQHAELSGAKVQAAVNPLDRVPREEKIEIIVAELVAEGRAEDSAYRIAEYQMELEERRLTSNLAQ